MAIISGKDWAIEDLLFPHEGVLHIKLNACMQLWQKDKHVITVPPWKHASIYPMLRVHKCSGLHMQEVDGSITYASDAPYKSLTCPLTRSGLMLIIGGISKCWNPLHTIAKALVRSQKPNKVDMDKRLETSQPLPQTLHCAPWLSLR